MQDVDFFGERAILAGPFDQVGPRAGGAAVIGADGKRMSGAMPELDKAGSTVISDDAGGWYVGGAFDAVNGEERYSILHVRADGSVDRDFYEKKYPSTASAFELSEDGETLYLSTQVLLPNDDLAYVVSIDTDTGQLTDWYLPNVGPASDLELSADGETIYVANGGLGEYSTTTGKKTDWNPQVKGGVWDVELRGDSVYVAGGFESYDGEPTVGGSDHEYLAELRASDGSATDWEPGAAIVDQPHDGVFAFELAEGGQTAYVGGELRLDGEAANDNLLEVDLGSGEFTDWRPRPNDRVHALAVGDAGVYVGGDFHGPSSIAGVERSRLALIDPSSGEAEAWDPSLGDTPREVTVDEDGRVAVAGDLLTINGVSRDGLAQLNSRGQATDWAPRTPIELGARSVPYEVAVSESLRRVYVAAETRLFDKLAAYSVGSGERLNWGDPDRLASGARSMEVSVSGKRVFTGEFGAVSAWSGGAGGERIWTRREVGGSVTALAASPDGRRLYVGGDFGGYAGDPGGIAGESRNRIAALSPATGRVLPWNPGAGGTVWSIAVTPDSRSVFVAGLLGDSPYDPRTGGELRWGVAKLSADGRRAEPWAPAVADYTIAVSVALAPDGNLFAAFFDRELVDGVPRQVAELDPSTARPTTWDPPFSEHLSYGFTDIAVSPGGRSLVIAGGLNPIGGVPVEGFALFKRAR